MSPEKKPTHVLDHKTLTPSMAVMILTLSRDWLVGVGCTSSKHGCSHETVKAVNGWKLKKQFVVIPTINFLTNADVLPESECSVAHQALLTAWK
jgi:hypothetical protein